MAHSTNIISSIKLPNGTAYEIHDAQAIHSAEELGLSAALIFKGTKASASEITGLTSAKVGDVWLCTGDNTEYVCVTAVSGTANASAWEKLGNVHDAASSNHTHAVTVTGTNAASTVTGTVTVPTVSGTQKYLTAANAAPEVTPSTDSVLGANTKFTVSGGTASTTKIKATASGAAVGANGTAAAITGFGTHTTDSALGTDATFKVSGGAATNSKMVTSTASKVSSAGSKSNGTAASWSATVTNGVLSFDWTANTPTTVTLPTFDSVTVATGALSSSGGGASVTTGVSAVSVAVDNADAVSAITALGTPTTANALTGVKMTAQPTVTISSGSTGDISVATGVSAISVSASGDNVTALTGVEVAPSAITLTEADATSTGAVPVVSAVSIGSTSASLTNGSAAAQKWTQASGSTGAPK